MEKYLSLSLLLMLLGGNVVYAQNEDVVNVYKSPTCDCCSKWANHLQRNGFKVKVHEIQNVSDVRKDFGMPDSLKSCHTAKIASYTLEGHVPANDIQRLLKERPGAIGMAVPGMPTGSPGMDIPNSPPYETLLEHKNGTTSVFAKH